MSNRRGLLAGVEEGISSATRLEAWEQVERPNSEILEDVSKELRLEYVDGNLYA
jgi:hypothetical protein